VDDLATGKITVAVTLSGSVSEVTTSIDGGAAASHPVSESKFILELTVPNPVPWSPDSPHLHTLAIATDEDDLIVRFGLRTIRTEGREILLNDRPIKLLGYNRHEFHPDTGSSVSPAQHLTDIHHLKSLGCNFVRGSHYPQDQRFLDLCDEHGLLV
jgi:beta-glucuronidase